ncbi:MAG: hypothetical protein KME13_11405 [Myxacorys californica WJT36-NPBG1]|jgi:hypothetical protein|nr:hypothetical protein [Myxacorys californica WJT36-NPBG1]
MNIAAEKASPAISQSCRFMPIGADIGNGALKLVSSTGETRLESYVYYLPSRSTDAPKGYVEYLSGTREDLASKQWMTGVNAYYSSPSAIRRVTDSKAGKVELGLQLLLGALSEQHARDHWELGVVVSVHDGKALGNGIKQALEGIHLVRMQGRQSQVTIKVLQVLEEGTGAIVHYKNKVDTTNAILYDLGNGTLIVSSFNGLQLTSRNYSQNGGVEKLIDAIATNEQVRTKLLKQGQPHLIRRGIEDRTFRYGTQYADWSFAEAYKAELPRWVNEVLAPMVRPTEDRKEAATALIAVGGGACLPGIATLLSKRDISVLDEPQWANARGLYAVAIRKTAQVEG